ACALAGAAVLLAADIIARLALASAELPIGVVTATLGAPVFIWLLLKAGR
ncbi:iron chelate uptake ABC transporter family permease subunit, partial [Franconibacter helveticus]